MPAAATAADRPPAHRLRIAPALVADDDAQRELADPEQPARGSQGEERLFFERHLVLGLITLHRPVGLDQVRAVLPGTVVGPLRREHDPHAMPGRARLHVGQAVIVLLARQCFDREVRSAHALEAALRKADQPRAALGSGGDPSLHGCEPVGKRGGMGDLSKSDAHDPENASTTTPPSTNPASGPRSAHRGGRLLAGHPAPGVQTDCGSAGLR
jgi:hypothetical protein